MAIDNNDLLTDNTNFNNFIWSDGNGTTATANISTGVSGDITISGDGWGTTPEGTMVKATKKEGMPVKIFFKLMKKKMGILKDYSYKKRIKKIESALQEAEDQGQVAFSEELLRKLLILCREAEMFANGKKIYIDRAIYDKFKDKTSKQVALTPLKNYARPIPDSVLKEKDKCDKAKLFDGYVVMHYDDNTTVKETDTERETREKDPILFGIVQNSEKLYFVDDWEDEYCDLTLDDIIDKLELEDEDITMSKKIEL